LWSGSTGSAGLGANEWMDDDDAYETGEESDSQSNTPTESEPEPAPEPAAQAEPAPGPEPAPSAPQETPKLHVSDLDNLSYWESSKKWIGAFVVEVADAAGHKLSDARVTIAISDRGGQVLATVPCTTNESGSCLVITSSQQAKKVDRMTATVQNVELKGYDYDAAANSDPDGDSDGISLTAFLPDRSRTSADAPQRQADKSVALATFDVDAGEAESDGTPSVVTPEQTIHLFLPTLISGK